MNELEQAALAAIISITEAVMSARAGKTDPSVALAAIGSLHAQLIAGNDAADTADAAKFESDPTKVSP